jgi:hypothetical protein
MVRQEAIYNVIESREGSVDVRIAASPDILFHIILLALCNSNYWRTHPSGWSSTASHIRPLIPYTLIS